MLVQNKTYKQAIMTTLADEEMMKVVNAVILCSKSINDIIRETGISHTTAYRKVKWMLENGLLTVEKINITKDGKRSSLLRSVFKSIKVSYEFEKISVEVEQNINVLHKIAEKMFSLDA